MNPYEPPRADVEAAPAPATPEGEPSLSPELELQAMRLLGQKRVRAAGISFGIWWAISFLALSLVTGLLWAFIGGGALAGVISKARVRAKTGALVAQVCAELGIPPGAFRPERYLI